jgi:NAD kinase
LFRIRTVSPKAFVVQRLNTSAASVIIDSHHSEDFVIEHLLEITNADEAIEIIKSHESDPQKQTEIFNEWQSKQ